MKGQHWEIKFSLLFLSPALKDPKNCFRKIQRYKLQSYGLKFFKKNCPALCCASILKTTTFKESRVKYYCHAKAE